MKKYTIQEVAKLLADKTHAVYCDVNEYELLRKILKLAFPKDEETDYFKFDFHFHYGYCKYDSHNWSNLGTYLEQLEIIKLSDVLKENEILIKDIKVNDSMRVETVTISKEDYDHFLKLEETVKNYIPDVSFKNVLTRQDLKDLKDKSKINSDYENAKKSDQKFLDKCAIGAMNGFISDREMYMAMMMDRKTSDLSPDEYISNQSYALANAMLTERNKNK